jgi:hypothetical protein
LQQKLLRYAEIPTTKTEFKVETTILPREDRRPSSVAVGLLKNNNIVTYFGD